MPEDNARVTRRDVLRGAGAAALVGALAHRAAAQEAKASPGIRRLGICDRGACGGCTVRIDGRTVNSCMMLAVDAEGSRIQTVEGLATGDDLHPIQEAFIKHDASQCGFCTPGMLMSCAALVEGVKSPTEDQIRAAVAGNLCRCGTYPHVFDACREAAR
jgi:aerobic-type carbon monoxide dehydrogenase small subunit (CoxS/CutS family)